MSELSLQADCVRAVNAVGGHAFKASNRFLVGVVDIYFKLPGMPGVWVEVKKNPRPIKQEWVKLDVTVPQNRFLQAEIQAGGCAGVVSFLTAPNKCWMAIYGVDGSREYKIQVNRHVLLKNRNEHIIRILRELI